MADKTLHIVDGESAGGTLRVAGFRKNGEILPWRDALYTGPVPAGLTHRQLSRFRSRFWTEGKSQSDFNQRDAVLASHARYKDIVLWFARDCVLCQLGMLQVLSWFWEHSVPAVRLSWIARHGGELRAQQVPDAYSSRRPITTAQMRLAERTWRAFRRPSPAGLGRLLEADLSCIPSLKGVLTRLLEEYPGKRNGLSRLEGELLREIHRRGRSKAAQAVGSVLLREYVGDVLLFDMLRNFLNAPRPLLGFAEPFHGKVNNHQFSGSILELTEVGRRIHAGKADHVTLNGIDRWIGGVHLSGHRVRWRWDGKLGSIAPVRN